MISEFLSGSGRHRHRNLPLPQSSVFSGKVGEWNSFIFQFCKTAHCYGWDRQEKVERLFVSLRGKAVDLIKNKSRKVQDDYRVLKDPLELRFGKENIRLQRGDYHYQWQHEGRSLEDLTGGVLAKVSEACPGVDEELEQDLANEAFLRCCQNCSAAYVAAEKYPEKLQML